MGVPMCNVVCQRDDRTTTSWKVEGEGEESMSPAQVGGNDSLVRDFSVMHMIPVRETWLSGLVWCTKFNFGYL